MTAQITSSNKLVQDKKSERNMKLREKITKYKLEAFKHFFCTTCQVECIFKKNMNEHFSGKRHKKNMTAQMMNSNELVQVKKPQQDMEVQEKMTEDKLGAFKHFFCKTCEVECIGSSTMHLHLSGKKHQENMKTQDEKKSLIETDEPDNKISGKEEAAEVCFNSMVFKRMVCEICPTQCQHNEHLADKGDLENVNVLKTVPTADDHKSSEDESTSGIEEDQSAKIISKDFGYDIFCAKCKIKFSKPHLYISHLYKNGHCKKNNAQDNHHMEQSMGKNRDVNAVLEDKADQNFFCDICQIKCGDLYSHMNHLVEEIHQNNIKEQNRLGTYLFTEAVQPNINENHTIEVEIDQIMETLKRKFFCNICQVECQGSHSYMQHLLGKYHQEVINRPQLNKQRPNQKIIDKKLKLPRKYFCTICHIACNGPQPYKQHLDSKNHKVNAISKPKL